MREVGIDLSAHASKTLYERPDPWRFDLVMTVCDGANAVCPSYPASTHRLHLSVADPREAPVRRWREERDVLAEMSLALVRLRDAGERHPDLDGAVGIDVDLPWYATNAAEEGSSGTRLGFP